ncbi:YybH family protein [Vibrio sp. WXL103]|uniref:YybH family protein n=1 Tax=unclassified Vibrio TaxID=2614977 RepID=UPI003EC567DE
MTTSLSSEQILMDLEREAYQRTLARDLVWMKDIHAQGALMLSPGSEGRLASDVYEDALAEQRANPQSSNAQDSGSFFWEPVSAQVSASDDMGWVYGVITITDASGNKQFGKYVSVWIKEEDKWKVAAEIRNMNQ